MDSKDIAQVSELQYDNGEDIVQKSKGGTAQDAHDMSRMGKKQQLQVSLINVCYTVELTIMTEKFPLHLNCRLHHDTAVDVGKHFTVRSIPTSHNHRLTCMQSHCLRSNEWRHRRIDMDVYFCYFRSPRYGCFNRRNGIDGSDRWWSISLGF